MERKTVTVTGMSCGGCETNVEDNVGALDGVDAVEADHERDSVAIEGERVSTDEIVTAIEDAGYQVDD